RLPVLDARRLTTVGRSDGGDVDFRARAARGHSPDRPVRGPADRTNLAVDPDSLLPVPGLAAAASLPRRSLAAPALADRPAGHRRDLGRYHRAGRAPAPAQAIPQAASCP